MSKPGNPSTADIVAAKKWIRSQVRAARDSMSTEQRAAFSQTIAERLLALPEFQQARCALVYCSFGTELDASAFIAHLHVRGCRLVFPRIERDPKRLELYRVDDPGTDLVAGVWGIREPDPTRCRPAHWPEIDAALIPGVAFTPGCDRLGYGGGFYDGLLGRWDSRPPLIAAAFDIQIVDGLPVTSNDQPVDCVVSETRLFRRALTPHAPRAS